MHLPWYIRASGILVLCTVISVLTTKLLSLGLFAAATPAAVIVLSLGLALSTVVFMSILGAAICLPLRISSSGALLATACGALAGTIGIEVIGCLHPGAFSGTIFDAAMFSFANVMLFWGVAAGTKSLRSEVNLLPKFEARR